MAHLALVTGSAKRIGRAIALRLADAGCDIAVTYNTSVEDAARTVREIEAKGRRAHAIGFDQSDPAAIASCMTAIRSAFGRAPDVLVNSASTFEWDSIATVDADGLDRHMRTNLYGPVLLTRAVADAATDATRGLILNISDHKLPNPHPDHLSYTLSKFAIEGFTAMMARALAPRFRVCAIAPGHTLPGPGESEDHFARLHDATPLERGPTPSDIAEAAAFLLASPAITGQTLIVDGGSFLAPQGRDAAFR